MVYSDCSASSILVSAAEEDSVDTSSGSASLISAPVIEVDSVNNSSAVVAI